MWDRKMRIVGICFTYVGTNFGVQLFVRDVISTDGMVKMVVAYIVSMAIIWVYTRFYR